MGASNKQEVARRNLRQESCSFLRELAAWGEVEGPGAGRSGWGTGAGIGGMAENEEGLKGVSAESEEPVLESGSRPTNC